MPAAAAAEASVPALDQRCYALSARELLRGEQRCLAGSSFDSPASARTLTKCARELLVPRTRRGLRAWRLLEWLDVDALVADVEDLQVFRAARCMQDHAVARP